VLEPLAAQLAAERRGGGVRSQLEELRDRLANPENERLDRDEALRWDVRIHRAIYAAAGNSHLQATLERYSNLATRIWCVVADRIPELQEHITVHSALLTAVLEGDAEEAAGIMLTHVRDFETQIRQVL
jgi:DNA-binding FadR family transcriptional regulator